MSVPPGMVARRPAQAVGEGRAAESTRSSAVSAMSTAACAATAVPATIGVRGVEAERPQPIVAADGQPLERHSGRRSRRAGTCPAAAGATGSRPAAIASVQACSTRSISSTLVHRGDRVRPVLGRSFEVVLAGRQQRIADGGRALRHLEARDRLAGHELDQAVMREVIVGCDQRGRHGLRTIARWPRRRAT